MTSENKVPVAGNQQGLLGFARALISEEKPPFIVTFPSTGGGARPHGPAIPLGTAKGGHVAQFAYPGLAITHGDHTTRLKWHRLRRRRRDPVFDTAVMAEGFRLGASMELDMRVLADGTFVVLHDADLAGETTGSGCIAGLTPADLADIRFSDGGRTLLLSTDLAAMLTTAHPAAVLQFDMKDTLATIGAAGVAHLAEVAAQSRARVAVSGDNLELIEALAARAPAIPRGIDPTDKLVAIYRQDGAAAVETALLADLAGPTQPEIVYLHWQFVTHLAADGLDLVALCRSEGKTVDAWTFNLADPDDGFSDAEWADFKALMDLWPDQITTDEAPATEAAWRARMGG